MAIHINIVYCTVPTADHWAAPLSDSFHLFCPFWLQFCSAPEITEASAYYFPAVWTRICESEVNFAYLL